MNDELIPKNSKIEVLILINGELCLKIVRVLASVKRYIFDKMITNRYIVLKYQIL